MQFYIACERMTGCKTCIKVTIAKLFPQFKADFTRSAVYTRLVNRYIIYSEVTATEVCKVQLCLWFYIETISRFYSFAVANTELYALDFTSPDLAWPISLRAVNSLEIRPT